MLLHGLLLSRRMHEPLARSLAERGNHVVTLDLLGHGSSDRPLDAACYSMTAFGQQTIALLDHLEIEEAVVMGTSLGANTALEAAALAPERLRGMVIEMPVLDGALLACALAFTPLMIALSAGEPLMRIVQFGARRVPALPWAADFLLDTVRQDPAPGAAVLQGLFFGRIAPHRTERRTLQTRDARDRASPRPAAPVLRRRHAGRGAAATRGCWRRARSSSCALAPKRLTGEIAALHRRVLAAAAAARAPRESELAGLGVALHGGHQLVELGRGGRGVVAGHGVGHAVAHVAVEHLHRDLLERGLDGRDLGEDVDAVGVLPDHPLEARGPGPRCGAGGSGWRWRRSAWRRMIPRWGTRVR